MIDSFEHQEPVRAHLDGLQRGHYGTLVERMAAAAADEAARIDPRGIPWSAMSEDRRNFCRAIMLKAVVAGSSATEADVIEALLIACEKKVIQDAVCKGRP